MWCVCNTTVCFGAICMQMAHEFLLIRMYISPRTRLKGFNTKNTPTRNVLFNNFPIVLYVKTTKAKTQQKSQLYHGQFKGKRAALGGILTHNTLQSRRALNQQSYQGNLAGRGSHLQHKGKNKSTTCTN